jgi:dUTP pyrophosphatase
MSTTARIEFQRLHESATLPTRGSENSAGLDLYSIDDVTLGPHESMGVRTGLAVSIPKGFYGRVAPRSGLAARHAIDVLAGVIDSDYRGEIICLIINHSNEPVHLEAGSRIAQLIVEAIITPAPAFVDSLEETTRGVGGFGSTGSK